MPPRTLFYVDALNLYYGLLRGTPYRWLDLQSCFQRALQASDIEVLDGELAIKFYSAYVSGTSSDRQKMYFKALQHSQKHFEIILGKFKQRVNLRTDAHKPDVQHKVVECEEKGTDVNLAVDLVHDAWADLYDRAVVVSNDWDFVRALKFAKSLNKTIGLLPPVDSTAEGHHARRPNADLVRHSTFRLNLSQKILAESQLPVQVGRYRKPCAWCDGEG